MTNLGDGKFEFVFDDHREMYITAYKAITTLELWDFISKDPGEGGFMFSKRKEVERIYNKIEDFGYKNHSGASFGFTLRAMQYISKNGYDKFKEEYLSRV
jgi:hypothetical protein